MSLDNNSAIVMLVEPPGNASLPGYIHSGNTNHATNVTVPPDRDPLVTFTVPAIMFASGVFGNLVAIIVLLRSSRDHKQTVFYRLVGALAATDLFGTCATSPVTLAVYANNLKWVGGKHLCNYEAFIFVFVSCTTIYIIGTMAVDRVLAVTCPFFYERNLTYGRAKYCILLLWGTAALMGCLPLIGLGQVVNQYPGTWCFFSFTSHKLKNQIFAYGYACIGLFIVCLTGTANIIVTIILLRMRRSAARTMNIGGRKRNDRELQMMVLMFGVIAVFASCWCPFLIRILINQIYERQVDVRADLHALRLASLNQILDPWVYILFRRELFKRTYLFLKENVFGGCKCFLYISSNRNALSRRQEHAHVTDINNTYAHAQDFGSEYMPLNPQGDADMKEIKNGNCVINETNTFKSSSMRSKSNSNNSSIRESEENVLLPPSQGPNQAHLHLEHSACLFCLSNHPKKVTFLCAEDRRSLGKLNLLSRSSDEEHIMANVKIRDQNVYKTRTGKRQSIHLSLEDLRMN